MEDVPKPLQPSAAQISAAKQSIANQNTANQSTVNNNQNTTPSTNTAKTVSYDSTPIPQTQLKTTKPQVQANYVYTEPKTNTANQYTSPYNGYTGQSITNTATQSVKQTAVQNTTPQYSTKDRVDNAWVTASVETTKTDWNKLFGINKNTDYWGYPKSIKDGAEPKVNAVKTPEVNYGINREIAETTPKVDDSIRQIYIEYLKRGLSEGVGVSNETAQSNFLDHRGQNAIEKIVERNPFDTVQETQFVTKDNVYEQPPEKIKTELTNTGTLVNNEISDLKRQREDLLFDMRFGYIPDGEEILREINKEIRVLNHIEKKISLGIKSGYDFIKNDIDKLSGVDSYDMLYSKEYTDIIPYTSGYANAIRAIGQGVQRTHTAVDIVDNIEILFDGKRFVISDAGNPNSGFSFEIEMVQAPQGYTEPRIIVNKDNIKQLDNVQYDLLKAMDNLVIPDNAKRLLEELAENKNISKANTALGVSGYVIDIVDFMTVVASDYSDDNEFGTDSSKAAFEMVGSWAGDMAGGLAGAKAGAAVGAVFGPVGVVIGGVLGAAFGAYVLSNVMEDIGGYVGEHINDSDYTIEQYYERGR